MPPDLQVSVSPHIRSQETVPRIMWTVAGALVPAGLVGLYVFGWRILVVVSLSVLSCIVTEAASLRARKLPLARLRDGSAVVTGVLLAFVLPPHAAWYVPVVGGMVAIGLAKQLFGGLGHNVFNPALIGRAFLQFAFPLQLNHAEWPYLIRRPLLEIFRGDVASADAIAGATPLAVLKDAPGEVFSGGWSFWDLFSGYMPGCIGETSSVAIILGGALLIALGYVNWRLPVAYLAALVAGVLLFPVAGADGALRAGLPAIFDGTYPWQNLAVHVFSGGLMLGAFFMITDMVTSPMTSRGQVIYGVIGGIMVALIRLYGGYPEGVCYSILIANGFRPMIDRFTMPPRVFGQRDIAAGGTS
ncbi:MAG: RnfABCDGE type electron transport complex subunit D [Planctomycetes bacterium]|nr:RnfABCDGE type electron transport complex subunit D [Planctomycetota bacterium]